jgi:hypothetical protein
MAFWGIFDRRTVRVAYVVGAAILATITQWLFDSSADGAWIWMLVTAVYLGPLGIAAIIVLGLPADLILAVAGTLGQFVYVILAAGVAVLNIVIIARWHRSSLARAAAGDPVPPNRTVDHVLGAVLFVLAGCGFIVLCFIAGFEVLTAHGIDSAVPDAVADPIVLAASLTWWPGFAIALAGLAVWIVQGTRHRRILPWAIADFALMFGLNIVLIAVQAANSR